MRTILLVLLCLTVVAAVDHPSQGQAGGELRFEQYSADVWHGGAGSLNLRSHPSRGNSHRIRRQLRRMHQFRRTLLACLGSHGCSITAIVDARNGTLFPEVLNGWTGIVGDYDIPDGEDLRMFKADSRLLRAIGRPRIGTLDEERYGPSGIYYYEWINNRLRFVGFTHVGSYPEADPLRGKHD